MQQQNNLAGDLDIKVIDAKLTRDTEFFGKMSPFVQVEIGGEIRKTSDKRNAGKQPIWDEVLHFRI